MGNKHEKIKRNYMLNFVIYTHTDYLDVLTIQTDYCEKIYNKVLFINENSLDLSDIYSKYERVCFYKNEDPYSKRLIQCLNQIEDDYIVFFHDIDILINMNPNTIITLHDFLKTKKYDRIDLKHTESINSSLIYECLNIHDHLTWGKCDTVNDTNMFLIKQDDPREYIYNVNPSIWRRETLLEIMNKFPTKTYRTIEDMDVQLFCKKYNIFKLYSKHKYECGYFNCVEDFKFLHISHNGKLLPLNDYRTVYGQSYLDVKDEYESIVNKFDLKKNNKWIN